MAYSLYRYYGAGDVLLYVGISISAVRRMAEHKDAERFFQEARRIDIEPLKGDRDAALRAERIAIEKEKPKYNVLLSTTMRKRPHRWTKAGVSSPAEIVRKLFGTRSLAKSLGFKTRDAVLKWGRTGLVPSKHHARLLELAKQQGKRLTADMLIIGA